MKSHHRICLITLVVAVTLIAGCEKKDEKKITTQVAAKVNSTEITVSEISNILARTPNVPPEVADKAKREILDKLIDQQLARQQAIDKKLDRSPNVMQAIEAAKTEILARAYLERIAAEQPKPTPEARKDAETAARLEAEAKARAAPSKPVQLQQKTLEKGISGLK